MGKHGHHHGKQGHHSRHDHVGDDHHGDRGRHERHSRVGHRDGHRRHQVALTVERVEWLTDRMVRVVAGGAGFDQFEDNGFTDRHVKIYFAKPGLGLQPPDDVDDLRRRLPKEDLPVRRTYTVRRVDRHTRTLVIDFVVHGDEGVAGPWAAAARPGDPMVVSGPGGKYAPRPDADWHLFAGDESAIPAIGAALEALPADAQGVAYLEVEEDELAPRVNPPAGVRVELVRRNGAGNDPERLSSEVASGAWLPGQVQVFAHGERESMKRLRKVFKERGVGKHWISLSGYWAYGRTEDRLSPDQSGDAGDEQGGESEGCVAGTGDDQDGSRLARVASQP